VNYIDVKRQLAKIKAGKMLDIGCGKGNTIQLFSFQKWECVGVDISVKELKLASKYGSVVLASGEALPFRDQCFKIITVEGLLHHIEKPQLVFLESYRTLKDGSFLLLLEVVEDDPLTHIIRNIHPYYGEMRVRSRLYSQNLISLAKATNFKIVDLGVKKGLFSSTISIIIQLLLLATWRFKKRDISYFFQRVLALLDPLRENVNMFTKKYPTRFINSIYLLLAKISAR
jgi:ubiquinone/menaquinone biosynthesis C-methylase UbiE